MPQNEAFIPDWIMKRSFGFKTAILIIGAGLILTGSLIRPKYPILWVFPFVIGALIEWLIVATVYVEINQVEDEAIEARNEVRDAVSEIRDIRVEVEETKNEIQMIEEDVFSYSPGSNTVRDTVESRLSALEREVGTDTLAGSGSSLEERVSKLESKLDRFRRSL